MYRYMHPCTSRCQGRTLVAFCLMPPLLPRDGVSHWTWRPPFQLCWQTSASLGLTHLCQHFPSMLDLKAYSWLSSVSVSRSSSPISTTRKEVNKQLFMVKVLSSFLTREKSDHQCLTEASTGLISDTWREGVKKWFFFNAQQKDLWRYKIKNDQCHERISNRMLGGMNRYWSVKLEEFKKTM